MTGEDARVPFDPFVQGTGPDGRQWLGIAFMPLHEYLSMPRWARWTAYLEAAVCAVAFVVGTIGTSLRRSGHGE